MALDLKFGIGPSIKNIFKHSVEFSTGMGKVRQGQATAVVANDGTGDFDSIMEAIDSLPSGGGVVYIKEGTYTITSTIESTKNNVTLTGAGKSTKITTNADIGIIRINGGTDWIIQNLFISGAGSGNTTNSGIDTDSQGTVMIDHCFIENCGIDGISLNGIVKGNIISNNIIKNNLRWGIRCRDINESIFTGNIIDGNTDDGILFDTSSDNQVTSNVITNNGSNGIQIDAGANTNIIVANHIKGNTTSQINDSGTGTVIANNVTA